MDETLTARLSQPLDPKRVKTRSGRGNMSLSYLETHDVIRTANDVFGFGGWGYEVMDLFLILTEPVKNDKGKEGFRVGYRCTVRLTVDGCVPVCGVGYGDAVEYTGSQITPHELAAKEAESDALKRAFRNFGDQFGLSLYSKDSSSEQGASTPSPGAPRSDFNPPNMTAEIVKLEVSFREKIIKLGVVAENESAMQAARASMNDVEYAAWLTKVNAAARKELEKVAA